jgi:serine/threonine protein kinase
MLPKYEVSSLIGRGGMGAVYLGRQDALDRPVAIKILPPGLEEIDPAYGARFRQEAMALAKLNHPGIVAVYDFGRTEQGLWYIVMEYVDGTDVARMIQERGRLRSKDAMAVTAHVCDALAYAHARGIVHRDIKPANILIGVNGAVKVADFGLAKAWQAGGHSLTMSGMAMGTPDYIAPEALAAEGEVGAQADVYALGVMLYHMLTGDLPRGLFELASKKINGLDPRFDDIIAQAMKNDPAQRYPGVEALRRDLDALFTTPAVKVDPAASQAPAALNTVPQPRRPAPPPARQPTRPQPRKKSFDWSFWGPVGAMAVGLVSFVASQNLPPSERKTIQRLEGEALQVEEVTAGRAATQKTGAFHAGVWSADAHLWWVGGKLGERLKLQFSVSEPGLQRVKAVLTGAYDYAVAEVSLDGRVVQGSPFDMQVEAIVTSDILDWGVFDLRGGDHVLEVKLVANHGKVWKDRDGFCFGLDYLQFEPQEVRTTPAVAGTDVAPQARPSSSQCSGDHVRHMNDGKAITRPDSGRAQRMTWHPHRGGMEWVQLEWETPQILGECQVVWFVDAASALPEFWRLLYREESGAWVPVDAAMPAAEQNKWCVVKFPPIKTTALRIAAQCKEGFWAGICHWRAITADPADAIPAPVKRDLLLSELSPLHAQSGWGLYRANNYGAVDERHGRGVFLGGVRCTHYLWAHPMSRTVFAIPSGCTSFTTTGIGPSDLRTGKPSGGYGSWKHIIEVDGKKLFESKELKTYPGQELPIAISFPAGSRQLTLITDNCGDGNSDHAFWAYPTLQASDDSIKPLAADAQNPPVITLRLASDPKKAFGAQPGGDLRHGTQPVAFRVVPGIADRKLVSLEMVGSPGHFVRHSWAVARVQKKAGPEDDVFDLDATWKMTLIGDARARFESLNYPGTFLVAKDDGSVVQVNAAPLSHSVFLLK